MNPDVFALIKSSATLDAITRCYAGPARVTPFSTADALRAACTTHAPLLLIAELTEGDDTTLRALQSLAECDTSPRRLFLVDPAILEDVMQETFYAGQDTIILWPSPDLELRQALHWLIPDSYLPPPSATLEF